MPGMYRAEVPRGTLLELFADAEEPGEFQLNLGADEQKNCAAQSNQAQFQAALGVVASKGWS